MVSPPVLRLRRGAKVLATVNIDEVSVGCMGEIRVHPKVWIFFQ